MKKILAFIAICLSSLMLTSCANNRPFALKRHFSTGYAYLYTKIPEPLEIDLAFMKEDLEYSHPTYSSTQNFAIFPYRWGNTDITIKALPSSFMEPSSLGSDYQPPQNVSDSVYMDYAINYSIRKAFPKGESDEIVYNAKKNYSYTCLVDDPKQTTTIACLAVHVTVNKSIVIVETSSTSIGWTSKEGLASTLKSLVEEIKPVGNNP